MTNSVKNAKKNLARKNNFGPLPKPFENFKFALYVNWCYLSKRGQNGPKSKFGPFWPRLGPYHQYSISNTPQTIYFWNLHIAVIILRYRRLKANNLKKIDIQLCKFEIFEGGPKLFYLKKEMQNHKILLINKPQSYPVAVFTPGINTL